MEAIHTLGILNIKRNVEEDAGFLLTNKKGGYCSFYNKPLSRYQGLFYFDEKTMDMYKFIEDIGVTGSNDAVSLKNGFYFAQRRKGSIIETFQMPAGFNSLIYELSDKHEIDLIMDCKLSADNREWGRYYDISEEGGCLIIKFTKKTDAREDATDAMEEYNLYLAIKSDKSTHSKNDKWVERHYLNDEERNSQPFRRYVYNAVRLLGSRFVFSMSKNMNNAINECEAIFNNLDETRMKEKNHFIQFLDNNSIKKILKNDKIGNEIKIAYINAANSLNNLVVDSKYKPIGSEFGQLSERAAVLRERSQSLSSSTSSRIRLNETHPHSAGIFAGLPWFFQFWARDTLISLKALFKIKNEFAKKMLFAYLNKINEDGRLVNLSGKRDSAKLGCADANGWLFLRCNEIVEQINNNKDIIGSIKESMILLRQHRSSDSIKIREYLKKCNSAINKKEYECHKTIYEIESSLEKSLASLLKLHTKDSFEVNEKLETWMDTEFGNDTRDGIRIEIQALRLNMYKLMFELTQNQKYRILENISKNKIIEKFWNGKILADGLNDFTIRPNIFIAAYAYPELLTNKEWEICFDNALKGLWLDWGGLSTIDKNNPLFAQVSTGENIKSYHRGDSWFWINNLSALVLNRVNKTKFKKQIQKIILASTEEILWKGCIGCHAELSSAKELSSKGCFNQAWSNAMFIELIDEVYF